MEVSVGKLVGKLGQRTWAQVYDFTPETQSKLAARGRLLAVVSLTTAENTEQVELVQAGREILSRLHEHYFGEGEGEAFEILKAAVKKVSQEYDGVEVAGIAIVRNFLYIVTNKETGVWIRYQYQQGWLVKPENREDKQISAFSGKADPGETIVLGNKKFWSGVTEGMVRAAAETAQEEMEAGIETLAAAERGNEMAGGEAGAIVVIKTLEEPEKEEEMEKETEVISENPVKPEEKKENIFGRIRERVSRIYIKHGDRQEQRKKTMYIGVGFLIILLLMAGFGQLWVKQRNLNNSAVTTKIEKLVDDFSEAKADATLNPPRSRQLLQEIKITLDQLNSAKEKDARISAIAREYDQVLREAEGIVNISVADLIDLSLVRTGIEATRIAENSGKLEVLDAAGSRIVEVDIKSEAGNVIAGGDTWKGARILMTYPGKIMAVTDNGIMAVGTSKPVIESDKDWANILDAKVYAGNIYALDNITGQIWRFNVTTSGGFNKKQSWLLEKNGDEELKQGLSMAIDGSIWVIKPGGLVKYTRGVKEEITISGLDLIWDKGVTLFTDENTTMLYVLDPTKKRVVILTKDGQYEKQLVSDVLEKARDMTVDEQGKKLYFEGGGKVWAASL